MANRKNPKIKAKRKQWANEDNQIAAAADRRRKSGKPPSKGMRRYGIK